MSMLNAVERCAFGNTPSSRNVVERTCMIPNDSPLSPTASMLQYDSLAAWARSVFSSKPHLHAAHWMISSVVPVKFPVTRGHCRADAVPRVLLYGVLSGRTSGCPRRTAAEHCASDGSAPLSPTHPKYEPGEGGGAHPGAGAHCVTSRATAARLNVRNRLVICIAES